MKKNILKTVSDRIHQLLNKKKNAPISQTQRKETIPDIRKEKAKAIPDQSGCLSEKVSAQTGWNSVSYDKMDGEEFEYFCAKLLCANGFMKVELTKKTGDLGVDILAVRDQITYAVQCKCHTANIGTQAVRDVHSGKECYHCMVGVVMTNRFFTNAAKKLAAEHNVLLWDREQIDRLLKNAGRQVYEVGKDIEPGEYWIFGEEEQRWKCSVAQDRKGTDILFQIVSEGRYVVEVKVGEHLILEGAYLQPVTFRQCIKEDNGWFAAKVGRELEAGEYKLFTVDEEISGYYAVYQNARYMESEKIHCEFFEGSSSVLLQDGTYLLGENCSVEKVSLRFRGGHRKYE